MSVRQRLLLQTLVSEITLGDSSEEHLIALNPGGTVDGHTLPE
jgi:hypothetical protein